MYEINLWLQSFESEWLTAFFLGISNIISPLVLCVIGVLVYWCFDKKKGLIISLSMVSAVVLNTAVKLVFKVPRPFKVLSEIKKLDVTEGYSFPSGHAQQSATVATAFCIGKEKGRKLLWIMAVAVFLVSLSRMYLGMHTILDVTVGAAVGILSTWAFHKIVEKLLNSEKEHYLYIFTAVFFLIMFFTGFDENVCKMTGVSIGAVSGYLLDKYKIGYVPPVAAAKKISAAIIGLLIIGVEKGLTSAITPDIWFCKLTEYAVFGFVITAVVPLAIKKIIGRAENNSKKYGRQ